MARKRTPTTDSRATSNQASAGEPQTSASIARSSALFVPQKIVSGGQTGVDRAGLEVAIALGIEHGGWCPLGRRSEDGTVPSRYELKESESHDYTVRTRQNVIDSDATLILYEGQIRGGTKLTKRLTDELNQPCLCLPINEEAIAKATGWLKEIKPNTLNVAGPRESSSPGIETRAFELLLRVFQ